MEGCIGIVLQNHSLLLLLIIGTAFTFCWLLYHKRLLNLKWYTAVIVAVLHTVWGVICVKAFAIAEAGFDKSAAGNMSLFGAVFLMPVFYAGMAKALNVKFDTAFDYSTICMIFTVMCARINCIFTGCCFGWYISNTQNRWPTRETELLFYILLMVWIVLKLRDGKTMGAIYPVYMMAYGVFRFINEFFRFHSSGTLFHPAHAWSIISFCIGLSIFIQIKNRAVNIDGKASKNRR